MLASKKVTVKATYTTKDLAEQHRYRDVWRYAHEHCKARKIRTPAALQAQSRHVQVERRALQANPQLAKEKANDQEKKAAAKRKQSVEGHIKQIKKLCPRENGQTKRSRVQSSAGGKRSASAKRRNKKM